MTANITIPIAVTRVELPMKISTVQKDTGRKVTFIMTDLDIPAGTSARIYAKKPSGAEIYNNCEIGKMSTGASTVTVQMTSAMLEEPGEFMAQIQVQSGDDVVTSFCFTISNAKNLISQGAIEGTNEYTALEKATQAAEQATTAANTAAQGANAAKQNAQTAANSANTAATSASTAADQCETATQEALTAASSATAAAQSVNTAAQEAEKATRDALDAAAAANAAAEGDISNKTVTFEQATQWANVETGDSMAVALGKLALLFSKLGDPADLDPEATDIVAAINSLNTNRYNAPMTLTGQWTIGFNVRGWGVAIPILTSRGVTIDHAEIYDGSSNWVSLTYQSQLAIAGTVYILFEQPTNATLEMGYAYLTRITGTIA